MVFSIILFLMGKVFPFCMISFFPVVLLIQSVILFKLTPHPLQANCSTMCATKEYGFKYLQHLEK